MKSTLGVSLTIPSADDADYVMIEQEPWPDDVGRTSNSQGILAIGSMIFGGSIPLPNCGGLAGFDTPVYTYPSRPSLAYTFKVSHGLYQFGVVEILHREEIIQCGLRESAETHYPVVSMGSMMWLGKCYNEEGNVVLHPAIRREGRTLFFNAPVYGSLRVRYQVYRKIYNVHIEEREDSIENNFECVAYCLWTGGLNYKEIKAPNGYDDTKGNCGNGLYGDSLGSGVEICSPDWGKGTYPVATSADKLTKIDYCPQIVKSETITESRVTDNEPGEECSDGPITTN